MTADERIENLERELVALRAELAERVCTRTVKIVDENGKPRASLCVSKDGAGLILFDENGKAIWQAP